MSETILPAAPGKTDNRPRARTFKCETCGSGIHCYHTTVTDNHAGHKMVITLCPHAKTKTVKWVLMEDQVIVDKAEDPDNG